MVDESLLRMLDRWLLFMGQMEKMSWVERREMKRHDRFVWMGNKNEGQRRVFNQPRLVCLVHKIRGVALNAGWSVGAEKNILLRNWGACVDTIF